MMATLAKAKATPATARREREEERERGMEIVTMAAETAEEAVVAVQRLFDAMSTSVALRRSWG